MSDRSQAIGIIGGTGLETYPEIESTEEIEITTPYGNPSSKIIHGRLQGQEIFFLPRHGEKHQYPPCRIPYKANLAALKQVGVRTVVATCIVGSLKQTIKPGDFLVPDQFMNFTWGRDSDSIEPDGKFAHLSMADPYCENLRTKVSDALQRANVTVYNTGTIVVIQGPRFTTRAESRFFIRNDWDIVNMTQYPECVFARELGLCYTVMCSVTDWDVGIDMALNMRPENMETILQIFKVNTVATKNVLSLLIKSLDNFSCACAVNTMSEYYRQQ